MDSILYIDCDGVIFNTIETAFNMMRENNIDISNSKIVDNFFKNTRWDVLFEKSIIINDSINKINKIFDQKKYKDVIILTKLSGNYDEERIKRETFSILLPNIKVITLPRNYDKAFVVSSLNNILIDDEDKNINSWNLNGGVGIKFIKDKVDLDNNIIDDLDDIEKTKKVKLLQKHWK